MTDEDLLRHTIALCREKLSAAEGGPFAAIVAKDGVIIGRGWNQVIGRNDATAHAEMVAIREACRTLGNFSLEGAVIYASCEPCPMCLAAIYWSRLSRICYANTTLDAARLGFDDALLYRELALPPERRSLVAQRIPLAEALEVFAEWDADPGKIVY